MPELPEVETLRRELNELLSGRIIKKVEVLNNKTIFPLSPTIFQNRLTNLKIKSVDRRAKMLFLNLSQDYFLVFHLKMTGQLIFVPAHGNIISGGHPTTDVQTPGKHTRVIFALNNNSHLYFNDMRKFGWVKLVDKNELLKLNEKHGPEPLSQDFTTEFLIGLFKRYSNRTIKQILLDQTLIAGIGNIYADESCFLSGLMPNRKVKTLKESDIKKLYSKIIAVLKLSIKYGGTSSKNYRRSDGSKGNFVSHLFVYGRTGELCKLCKAKIAKIKHAGRGTHYCLECQK